MQNKWWKYGMFGIAGMLALCIVFGAGIFVGRWSVRGNALRPLQLGVALISGTHGAVGTIQSIDGQSIRVHLRNGSTETIRVDSQTRIDHNRRVVGLQNLKIGDEILAIGSPDAQGEMSARFVRVVDRNSAPAPWWQNLVPR